MPSPKPVPWLRWVGHCGFVAEGAIYLLIGTLALASAAEPERRPKGSGAALGKLGDAPFGATLLAMLALGLTAYVLWQIVQATFDPEHPRNRWTITRVAVRLGCLFNAALYCILVWEAAQRLLGFSVTHGHGRAPAQLTGRVLALPFGRWGIATVGAGIAVFGALQFYRAVTRSKLQGLNLNYARLRGLVVALGTVGFLARGILFALIGTFLIDAAWQSNAAHATGVAGALNTLKREAYGPWLLGAVATGLMAYGFFQIIREPYRKIGAS
jgi:hypothetical protein